MFLHGYKPRRSLGAVRYLQPPPFEALARNVHIYDGYGRLLGGFWQGGSVTNAMFYEMLPHFLFFHPSGEGEDEDEEMDSSVASRRDSGIVEWCVFGVNKYDGATEDLLPEDGDIVAPGLYVVLGPDGANIPVRISKEKCPKRILPQCRTARLSRSQAYFRIQIRRRDTHCMLSGTRNLEAELYDVESGDDDDFFTSDVEFAGFDAAHIFPVANEDDWVNEGYERFVQDDADREDVSLTKINSPQNGMLMRGDVHALWVAWGMAVNVDDGYKIISFRPTASELDGRTMVPKCLTGKRNIPPVNPGLLRWHFHKAILANVRGPYPEQEFEQDFGGADMLYQLLMTGMSEDVRKRIEVEMFTRLGCATGQPTGSGMSEGFLGVERAIEDELRRDVWVEEESSVEEMEEVEDIKGALFPGFSSDIDFEMG